MQNQDNSIKENKKQVFCVNCKKCSKTLCEGSYSYVYLCEAYPINPDKLKWNPVTAKLDNHASLTYGYNHSSCDGQWYKNCN